MLGPIECLSATFHEDPFRRVVASALADLVNRGIIHVIDIVFVTKAADGTVTVAEVDQLDAATLAAFESVSGEYGGLLSDEDLTAAAADLAPATSEVLVVWENIWEKEFLQIITDAGGTVAADIHVPADAAAEAFSSLPTASRSAQPTSPQ